MTQTGVGSDRGRSLVTVLLIVVGASVVIGGILSTALFMGASSFSVGDGTVAPLPHRTATDTELPTAGPTETAADDDRTESEPADTDPTEDPTADATEDVQSTEFSLSASATSVASQELVSLTGPFNGPDGTVLQVQRRLAGEDWGDFGVQATVRNGEFTTRVRTGRTGPNEFRVRDNAGAVTNAVTITVG